MIRNQEFLRAITAFFVLTLLTEVVFPTVAFALTSGPTAPEYNNFEPIDTTEMVDLATGDFTYNMPLLEVPGPEGGYPVSLSYHGGVLLDQDASWVGLGWTLNPGAINRTVDGFADDDQGGHRVTRDFWGGGTGSGTTHNVGVSVPIGGFSSVNFGLSVTKDSYRGVSRDFNLGFSHTYASGNALSVSNSGVGFSFGYRKNDNEGNTKPSSTGMGLSIGFDRSRKASGGGKITYLYTTSKPTSFSFLGVSIGRSTYKYRYYSDVKANLYAYGSLYPTYAQSFINTSDRSFDCYALLDPQETDPNVNVADPDQVLGGSFPAYDRYDVLGQGLGGTIQPYIFENGTLYRSNIYESVTQGTPPTVVGFRPVRGFSTTKVDFRFNHDFSNSLSISPSEITFAGDLSSASASSHTLTVNPEGYNNSSRQHLAGSKHIEWFTTAEIRNGTATSKGFIDYYSSRLDRANTIGVIEDYLQPTMGMDYHCFEGVNNTTWCNRKSMKPVNVNLDNNIGGYSITNEKGITYHYALPVYNIMEYQKTEVIYQRGGIPTYREEYNNKPYAYTWLLTAITGPDFVDKNSNGIADEADWGYWVKFEYGKWTDNYQWRNPHTGAHEDFNGDYKMFSYGMKELYYLDAIKTRTHTAIFEKSIRFDGMGVTNREDGGSKPRKYKIEPFIQEGNSNGPYIIFNVSPVAPMKLDNIYLLKNEDLASINFNKTTGDKYTEGPFNYAYQGDLQYYPITGRPLDYYDPSDVITVKYHYGDNVYDKGDIDGVRTELTSKSLKVVNFNTDYSLCNSTPNCLGNPCTETGPYVPDYAYTVNSNCFSQFLLNPCTAYEGNYELIKQRLYFYQQNPFQHFCSFSYSYTCCNLHPDPKDLNYYHLGKLTLKSVKILGKGGADLIPSTNFAYNYNPDYSPGAYDTWGYYKSDYNSTTNKFRATTDDSAPNTDAWSLTSVETPLGATINIEYESDEFSEAVLKRKYELEIRSIQLHSVTNQIKVSYQTDVKLSELLSVGDEVEIHTVKASEANCVLTGSTGGGFPYYYIEGVRSDLSAEVISIDDQNSFAIVESSSLYSEFASVTATQNLSPSTEVFIPSLGDFFTNAFGGTLYFSSLPFSYKGKLRVSNESRFGGGIRTKKISLTAGGQTYSTNYYYNRSNSNISSGITSFIPTPFSDGYFDRPLNNGRPTYKLDLNAYRQVCMEGIPELLSIGRMVPSPGVMYEYVAVKESFSKDATEATKPVFKVYNFEVFNQDMIVREAGSKTNGPTNGQSSSIKRTVKIKDYSSRIGNLKSVLTYDANNKLIHKAANNFLHDELSNTDFESELSSMYQNQGVVHQSFNEYRTNNNYLYHKAVVSVKEDYPTVLVSTESFDYLKGVTSKSENVKFDFYSGEVVERKSTDSYGNTFLSVVKPAYKVYTFANPIVGGTLNTGMGLKVNNIHNKNMLTQSCAEHLYKVESGGNKVVGVSIQTWDFQWKYREYNSSTDMYENVLIDDDPATVQDERVWRKSETFSWNTPYINQDGTFKTSGSGAFSDFDWVREVQAQDQLNTNWQKNSEITLYDKYSNPLEMKDVNGQYASTKLGYNTSQVISSGVNVNFSSFAYSGFEDLYSPGAGINHFGGELRQGGSQYQDAGLKPHTGTYICKLIPGNQGPCFKAKYNPLGGEGNIQRGRKYRASVWVHKSSDPTAQILVDVKGNSGAINTTYSASLANSTIKAGDWYLVSVEFDVPSSYVSQISTDEIKISLSTSGIGINSYFDDFMIRPVDAGMTSYVYDMNTNQVTYIIDKDGFYVRYSYDEMGRLIGTYKETLNGEVKVNSYNYNFGRNN